MKTTTPDHEEARVPSQVRAFHHRCAPQVPDDVQGTLLAQVGEMRLGPDRPWFAFSAEQRIEAERTGFVWHARCQLAPLLTGVVEDAYEDGQGRLDAKIWGVLPVAHGRGLHIDRGEAQRYLAELAWCPPALLRNRHLQFETLDEQRVRVWVGDRATSVDLEFDGGGDITGVYTAARPRERGVTQAWRGRFFDYRDFGELRAPAKAEVAWETAQGPFTYFRCELNWLRLRRPQTGSSTGAGDGACEPADPSSA